MCAEKPRFFSSGHSEVVPIKCGCSDDMRRPGAKPAAVCNKQAESGKTPNMNESQVISGLAEMPSAVNIQVWAPVLECIGLDLGDKESSWCRVGADNKVAGRGRVKTTRTALQH